MKTLILTDGAIRPDGRRLSNRAIGIDEDGRIEFGLVNDRVGPPSDDYAVLDRRSCTLVPLLADAHIHLGISNGIRESPNFHTLEFVDRELGRYLRCGVGHVLSLGTDQRWLERVAARRQRESGRGRATPYSAGFGFGAADGWPPELTAPEPRFRPEEPEKARRQVRQLARRNLQVVKLWVDDLGGEVPKLPVSVTEAIIDEAHQNGLTTYAHVYSLEDARNLLESEVNVLAHSIRDQLVDQRFANAMAERGTKLIPTLVREEANVRFASDQNSYLDDPFYRWSVGSRSLAGLNDQRSTHDPEEAEDHQRALETATQNLSTLASAGVTICMGTDAGFRLKLPGFSQHRELQLMCEAGLSEAEALTAALGNNRTLFAQSASWLQPGEPANFFLVEGNPLQDIHHTTKIREVWQSGTLVTAPSETP